MFHLTPEDKLLVACAIADQSKMPEYVVTEEIDWNMLSRKAEQHRMWNFLAYNLAYYRSDIPNNFNLIFKGTIQDAKEKYKKRYEILSEIKEKFMLKDYKFVCLKGIGLVHTVYKEFPYIKKSGDVDMLVPLEKSEEIYKFLLNNQFECEERSGSTINFYKTMVQHYPPIHRGDSWYEVHHRLNQFGETDIINCERLIDKCSYISMDGNRGIVDIPFTNPIDTILVLCNHQYQHEYRELMYRFSLLADLANTLLYYKDNIDWCVFIDTVNNEKLNFAVCYSLYNTYHIFKENLNIEVIDYQIILDIMPGNFMDFKDRMRHRRLFTEKEFGHWQTEYSSRSWKNFGEWTGDYAERLFGDPIKTKLRFYFTYFMTKSQKEWEEICEDIGFDKDDNLFI